MWSDWLVFSDCGFQPVCPLMEKDMGLWKLPDWRDWLRDLVLMGVAMLSKSLIQFSVDGQGCVPSLLFDLRPNYGGGNEDDGHSFKRCHAGTAALSAPNPAAGTNDPRPAGDSWTLTGKSGLVSCEVTVPFSWVAAEKPSTGECWIPPKKRYPVSKGCKNRRQKRSPSKMVGWAKSHLESSPIPARDSQRAQTNLVCTRILRPHRDWGRTVFECLLHRYGSAVGCFKCSGSGCSRPGYGISPLGGHH